MHRSSRCLFNTASALHSVFIASIEQSQTQLLLRRSSPAAFPNTAPKLFPPRRRCYAISSRPESAPSKSGKYPRDDGISSREVIMVDREGKLQEPVPTREVLSSINRNTHSLIIVAMGEEGAPPICKIIDKRLAREQELARMKQAKQMKSNVGNIVKTLELNWAIDGNDLEHRLKKMKEFLEKGNRVEIVLAPKRKGKKASEEEAESLLEKIRENVKSVPGGQEWKKFEGKILGQGLMFFERKKV
ncbi:hypothetical protein B7494_g1057 [Chlorociboria aeruginascens]|nr:hypothetical protein B7494_g1057 [Chlorociboria aeruginascens]